MGQITYVLPKNGIVWGDRQKIHKSARVTGDYKLKIAETKYWPILRIEVPAQVDLDRKLDLKLYPECWVDVADCVTLGVAEHEALPKQSARGIPNGGSLPY